MATRTLYETAQRLGPSVQEMSMILEQSCLQDLDLPITDDHDIDENDIGPIMEGGGVSYVNLIQYSFLYKKNLNSLK